MTSRWPGVPDSLGPDWSDGDRKDLVYGAVDESCLVFIGRQKADELVAVWDAINASKTWGDLKARLSAERYEEATSFLDEPPVEDEPYVIGLMDDGDWPEWPAQQMLGWVPSTIAEEFGRVGATWISGDMLALDAARETEIVAAFTSAGFSCQRDDELVLRASGGP